MFGTHIKQMAEDGTVEIPEQFQPNFALGGFLTRGIDKYLYLYPTAEWERLAEAISALPIIDPISRSFQRHIFAGGAEVSLRDGSITVPHHLRRYAELGEVVILAGMGLHVEIADEAIWRSFLEEITDPRQLSERYAELLI